MISFPELGRHGRLCNQLFQIAAVIALARDNSDDYGFPAWKYESQFVISGCFGRPLLNGPVHREPKFSYTPIPYQTNLRLVGYFQSEKYFGKHAGFIQEQLSPNGVSGWAENVASLHVRRDDYIGMGHHHHNLTMEYYRKAIKILQEEQGVTEFRVFSDDLPWCRETFTESHFKVAADEPDYVHLAAIASCAHHIIANSTYSWWGAWLCRNPGKVVIAPDPWFGPDGPPDPGDVLPPTWRVVTDSAS